MYTPRQIAQSRDAMILALAEHARQARLVIYAGAGLSAADPAHIPVGGELGRKVYSELSELLETVPACDKESLTSVADAVSDLLGGRDVLRMALLRAADYTGAMPNYGHQVVAYLLLDNAISVLTTNWDDCIERGVSMPHRVLAIVTEDDRVNVSLKALLKVHGCATKPRTLRVTTEELSKTA